VSGLEEAIRKYVAEVGTTLTKPPVERIAEIVRLLERTRAEGKRVYIFGNGGSAATASHFASDLSKGLSPRVDRE